MAAVMGRVNIWNVSWNCWLLSKVSEGDELFPLNWTINEGKE